MRPLPNENTEFGTGSLTYDLGRAESTVVLLESTDEVATSEAYQATLEAWEEIGQTLPRDMKTLAQQFVDMCEEFGAFHCRVACEVDTADDDEIMFDWNNGELPIFTVVIAEGPRLVYAGRFSVGIVKGEVTELSLLESPLRKLVQEIGLKKWTTSATQDSSFRAVNVAAETEHELHYTIHQRTDDYPYFQPTEHLAEISSRPGFLWQPREISPSTGGRT